MAVIVVEHNMKMKQVKIIIPAHTSPTTLTVTYIPRSVMQVKVRNYDATIVSPKEFLAEENKSE